MKRQKFSKKFSFNPQKATIFGHFYQAINQGQIDTPPINMYQVLRQPIKQDHPPIPELMKPFFSVSASTCSIYDARCTSGPK